MTNKKAFTLIELIVATSILTITVFWIYRLIWENTKIITNSNIKTKTALLFPIVEVCIENLGLENSSTIFIWEDYKSCSKEDKPNKIDGIQYEFYAEKKNENEWEIKITSDYWVQTGAYLKK
jgi:prepilin-type N-terminal cleavage/methylation domain-containing protein